MPTISVAAGCVSAPLAVPARSIVTVSPAAGATAVLEYTAGSASDVANGVAQWSSWPKGASTSQQQDIINEPAFLRLTATGGSATLTTEEFPTILARENFNSDWGGSKRYPFILAQSAIPVIVLSSGAITATGAVSGLTALPYIPAGIVRVYMFAQAGLVAGLYYANFNGTNNSCQLYLDAAGTITPTGITAGAYTGWTAGATVILSITVPGNVMGTNGALRVTQLWAANNAAGKTITTRFDGNPLHSVAIGAVAGYGFQRTLRNRGAASQVQMNNSTAADTGGSTPNYMAVDTTTDRIITFAVTLAAATDYAILEGYTVEILPG